MTAGKTRPGDSPARGHGDKGRLQEKAIAALLAAPTVEHAAKLAGVSRDTVYRWMREDAFQTALQDARRELRSTAIAELQAATAAAVAALRRNLAAGVPTVEVSAARAILEYGFRAKELEEFETRLAVIEERARLNAGGASR
jgi:transposase